MKQKLLIAFALLICITFVTTGISYAVAPQQQAIAFANKAFIDEAWQNLCVEGWESFKFENPEQVERTYLGEPLSFYFVDENLVTEEQSILQQAKQVSG